MNPSFWRGKKVWITGHTGFKGSWLALWLKQLGAEVHGLSLAPRYNPNLFTLAGVEKQIHSVLGDIRDGALVRKAAEAAAPEIVFHMAAQPLVRRSYANPEETFETNVMGTLRVFEALRTSPKPRAVVSVTTDKVYLNAERGTPFSEDDPLGGRDPYSASKACAEILTASYRDSFFDVSKVGVATARAGNVIGGGDWSEDRLVPDLMRAFAKGEPLRLRNPQATRPWQHVLDPLAGYLTLAEKLFEKPAEYSRAWNFGPQNADVQTVAKVVDGLAFHLGNSRAWVQDEGSHPHEARFLSLDCARAQKDLGWKPLLPLRSGLEWTARWYQAYFEKKNLLDLTLAQIENYEKGFA